MNEINFKENADLYMQESSISVSFASFMTIIVFFFVGLLLTSSSEVQIRLRVPIVFLMVSAFGFMYATLIYTNASGEVSRLRKQEFDKQMAVGNSMSEYFGVYCLVIAIPLTVLGHSPDKPLAIIILAVSCLGFLLYHLLGYSILERYFIKEARDVSRLPFLLVVAFLLAVQIAAFFTFYIEQNVIFYILSFSFLVVTCSLFFISIRIGEIK